jgi:hypothetical protein
MNDHSEDGLIALSCSHCSAPLRVPDATRFLTCQHCGSALAVKSSGGAIYTELTATVARIDQTTRGMAGDLDELNLRQRIEQLDRDWDREREELLPKDKHGRSYRPATGCAGAAGMGVGCLVLGAWMTFAIGINLVIPTDVPFPMRLFAAMFPLIGVGIIIAVATAIISGKRKHAVFLSREAAWRHARAELDAELARLERQR